MKREEIREKTMEIIYQMDAVGNFDPDSLSLMDENKNIINKKKARMVLDEISSHLSEIDELISSTLEGWTMDRLSKVDLAILRLAVCEMKYLDDIPISVTINEAVNLAKKYSGERSYAFINSLLAKISKEL